MRKWWQAFMYLGSIAMLLMRMEDAGLHGPIRTKIVAEAPDGAVVEFPFVTITV